MLPSLVMCLALTGRLAPDPPSPPERSPEERLLDSFIEPLHRHQLELTKSRRVFLEGMIEWYEKQLTDPSLGWNYTPKGANQLRHQLEGWRYQVEFMKKLEAELERYERQRKVNPGSETDSKAIARLEKMFDDWQAWKKAWESGVVAPMPREVKYPKK
ncbi:MAG: hypothetical protein L0241_01520 [Planctomycetia bacterium]|nr:hypothetical protein [Planctomycetia bacterium]